MHKCVRANVFCSFAIAALYFQIKIKRKSRKTEKKSTNIIKIAHKKFSTFSKEKQKGISKYKNRVREYQLQQQMKCDDDGDDDDYQECNEPHIKYDSKRKKVPKKKKVLFVVVRK